MHMWQSGSMHANAVDTLLGRAAHVGQVTFLYGDT